MKDSQLMLLIIFGLFWLLIGTAGSSLAKKRQRNQCLWFINCFLSGFLGLAVVACSSTLEYDEESGYKETDTLGWTIFFIILLIIGLGIWYVYLEYQAYQSQLFWYKYHYFMR